MIRGIARAVVVLGCSSAYIGCVATQQSVEMQTKFDYSEHRPYLEPGENSIKGQGFLRQSGGRVVTCAGSEVIMMPATSFFREVTTHLRAGNNPQIAGKVDPAFKPMIKQSQCDAQGNFFFTKIPNGAWFVFTQVKWTVGNTRQGGTLMREVTLSNNQAVNLLLTEKDFVGR